MFDMYPNVNTSHHDSYVDYVFEFNKESRYLLNGSDNYTELLTHYLAFIGNDDYINLLNLGYPKPITIYDEHNDSNGNLTYELVYTGTSNVTEPFGHNSFTDSTDDELDSYLPPESLYTDATYPSHNTTSLSTPAPTVSTIANASIYENMTYTGDGNFWWWWPWWWIWKFRLRIPLANCHCWGCTRITSIDNSLVLIPRYGGDFQFDQNTCGTMYDQGAYPTCWAFASTNQFECNYNQFYQQSVSFSQCYTIECSNVDGTVCNPPEADGGYPICANTHFVDTGASRSYPQPYSQCIGSGFGCSTGLDKSTECFCIDIDSNDAFFGFRNNRLNFLTASRLASQSSKKAMVFTVWVSYNFYFLSQEGAKEPINSEILCGSLDPNAKFKGIYILN